MSEVLVEILFTVVEPPSTLRQGDLVLYWVSAFQSGCERVTGVDTEAQAMAACRGFVEDMAADEGSCAGALYRVGQGSETPLWSGTVTA